MVSREGGRRRSWVGLILGSDWRWADLDLSIEVAFKKLFSSSVCIQCHDNVKTLHEHITFESKFRNLHWEDELWRWDRERAEPRANRLRTSRKMDSGGKWQQFWAAWVFRNEYPIRRIQRDIHWISKITVNMVSFCTLHRFQIHISFPAWQKHERWIFLRGWSRTEIPPKKSLLPLLT